MLRTIKLCFLVLICCHVQGQDQFRGKVIDVLDGNTLRITDPLKDTITVKLRGIDCPEISQAHGEIALKFTQKACLGKKVNVSLLGKDRWGNDIAVVFNSKNIDLSMRILEAGLAWHYEKYKGNSEMAEIEAVSRKSKIGIWEDEQAVAPWIYRRQQSMVKAKLSY